VDKVRVIRWHFNFLQGVNRGPAAVRYSYICTEFSRVVCPEEDRFDPLKVGINDPKFRIGLANVFIAFSGKPYSGKNQPLCCSFRQPIFYSLLYAM
jgi:hypothetical protein